MPSPPGTKTDQTRIPIGLVLVIIGMVIVITVVIVLVLAQSQTPVTVEQVNVPSLPIQPTLQPTPIGATIITPTPGNEATTEELPVLLPESPINTERLPSFASVAEAPTSYNQPITAQPLRLVIPQIGIDASVRRVPLVPNEFDGKRFFQWAVPNGYEVGWHESSAPLGQSGNTVLNGHNNAYGEVFRDLIDLEVGEDIFLYDSEGVYHYQVTRREILAENDQPLTARLENARWIEPTNDERITLISCWPYATNSNRLVVIAQPVDS